MRQFEVISLSVGGRRKVHHYGDIVTQRDFPDGNCDELVAKGFLREMEAENDEDEIIEDDAPEFVYNEISVKEIKAELEKRGIQYENSMRKKELFNLLK